jgi:hypothetical protein
VAAIHETCILPQNEHVVYSGQSLIAGASFRHGLERVVDSPDFPLGRQMALMLIGKNQPASPEDFGYGIDVFFDIFLDGSQNALYAILL